MDNIEILEWMIKEYDKRGGGYSQIEALKEAISCMKSRTAPIDVEAKIMEFAEKFPMVWDIDVEDWLRTKLEDINGFKR